MNLETEYIEKIVRLENALREANDRIYQAQVMLDTMHTRLSCVSTGLTAAMVLIHQSTLPIVSPATAGSLGGD